MTRFATQRLACWGNHPVQECLAARPERLRDLDAAIRDPSVTSVIPRGLGRSYGDASLNEGAGVVLHERLNRFIAFDPATGVLECEAGATIAEIIDAFLPRGFFPPVTPGTKFVTVGGAIAADIHGKNHHSDGSFAGAVLDFVLLTPSGERLTCSRESHPDLFWATLGGMGLTGAVVSARLRLLPVESSWITVRYARSGSLDETIAHFRERFEKHRYSVAWIDCLKGGASMGRSVLMGGDHAPIADLPHDARPSPLAFRARRRRSVPAFMPNFALNAMSVRAFNAVYYRAHGPGRKVEDYDTFFYPLDHVRQWNKIYGRRGFQQYQCVIPPEGGPAGLRDLLKQLVSSQRGSFLAVLKTMGAESGGLLSFPRPGWTLALDLPQDPGLDDFLRGLDTIVLAYGGRRYLAKDACLRREDFEKMYPRLAEFKRVRARVDPEGRMSSSLARRLGLAEVR